MPFFTQLPHEACKKKRLFKSLKKNLNKRQCLMLTSRLWEATAENYNCFKKIKQMISQQSASSRRNYRQNYPKNHRWLNSDYHHMKSLVLLCHS